MEFLIADVISEFEGVMSSREFIAALAERLKEHVVCDSFVFAALECGVPIFCPGIADSSIGIAAALSKSNVVIDTVKDI